MAIWKSEAEPGLGLSDLLKFSRLNTLIRDNNHLNETDSDDSKANMERYNWFQIGPRCLVVWSD